MENESEFPEVKRSHTDAGLLGLSPSEPYVVPRYWQTESKILLTSAPETLSFGNMLWTPGEESTEDPYHLNHLTLFISKSQLRKVKGMYEKLDYEDTAFFKTLLISLKNRANAARRRKAKQRRK